MFLSKVKREKDDIEVVKCSDCQTLVSKEDAQEIQNYLGWDGTVKFYYCNLHRKPYSRIRLGTYFGEVRMNEDGTPVGYIKKPENTPSEDQNPNGSK